MPPQVVHRDTTTTLTACPLGRGSHISYFEEEEEEEEEEEDMNQCNNEARCRIVASLAPWVSWLRLQ
jgi:hypothetical protein